MPAKKKGEEKDKPAKKSSTRKEKTETALEAVDQMEPTQAVESDAKNNDIPSTSSIAVINSTTTTNTQTTITSNSSLGTAAMTIQTSATATGEAPKKKNAAILQREERFDLNTVTLSGAIHSVWGSGVDVFARLGLSIRNQLIEEEDKFMTYATLRFANGMVAGEPISIQKGTIVRVHGYLTHREYNETLRKFLDDAHASSFFELVPVADLASWRALTFERQNGVANVLQMAILDSNGTVMQCFGFEGNEQCSDLNTANVEGVVARIWEYPRGSTKDLFARLAVYDKYTPVDPKREGNFGKERRKAHYITVRFPDGKTSSGSIIHLKARMRVRISGELRDKAQVVTLHEELLKTGRSEIVDMMSRVQNAEHMSEITNQQESLHILARAVIVYSMAGGSR